MNPFEGLEITMQKTGGLQARIEKNMNSSEVEEIKDAFLFSQSVDMGKLGSVSISLEKIGEIRALGRKKKKKVGKKKKVLIRQKANSIGLIFLLFFFCFSAMLFLRRISDHSSSQPNHQEIYGVGLEKNIRNEDQWIKTEQKAHYEATKSMQNLDHQMYYENPEVMMEKQPATLPGEDESPKTPTTEKVDIVELKSLKDTLEFKVGEKEYRAVRKLRPKVTQIQNTWARDYEYLRPTESEIITFPPEEWVKEKPQIMEYTEMPEESDRIQFINQLHLTKRKKTFLDYMFYKNLNEYPDSKAHQEAEYDYLSNKYDLKEKEFEVPFCIISTGRNLIEGQSYDRYLSSMNGQNYSNFHIFLIDDASTDQTTLQMYSTVSEKYPRLKSHITFIRNNQRIGSFANKDSAIKENCRQDSYVVEVDGDDWLIGRQVLNLLNSQYSANPETWVLYTSNILRKPNGRSMRGDGEKLSISSNRYRHSDKDFVTSHLKSYWAGLEMKIPIDYMTELLEINGQTVRLYPLTSSDVIMMYSLIEMAGNSRVSYISELVYMNNRNHLYSNKCYHWTQKFDQARMKVLPPLKELRDEDDMGRPKEGADYPEDIDLDEIKQKYLKWCEK